MDAAINEKWKQIAIEIGNTVFRTVNTPATVGTGDETGYVLMFFNTQKHDGKSTLVSSAANRTELKKLLKYALHEIDGPKATIVPQPNLAN